MAIGAALQKLCDAITCNWNCKDICNNNRCCSNNNNNTLILGDLTKTSATAKEILARQDLPAAMKALPASNPLPFVEIKQRNLRQVNIEEQTAAAKAGICGVKQFFAAQLNEPADEVGNGKSKRELVFVLANIDDDGRYHSGEALTKAEYGRLETNANKVKKYYKAAIYLRMKVKETDFEFSTLFAENPMLSDALTYLRGKMKLISKDKVKGEESFWKLSNIEQQTFLEASTKIRDSNLTDVSEDPDLQILLYPQEEGKSETKERQETDPLTSAHI